MRLRQIPDDGLNRLPRLLTVSADGESLRKSAIALASSPSLMGEIRGAQRANPETADNLVVVTVLMSGDEFANASQQGRDRQLNLPGACRSRALPGNPQTQNPASIRRY